MAADSYRYFRIEAREILEQLGKGALDLEKREPSGDAVAKLLRLAHTLKGAARVVKRRDIADLAHALEDALAYFRNASGTAPRDRVDRVLALIDGIGAQVGRLTPPPPPNAAPQIEPPPDPPLNTFRPATDDLDALLSGVFEMEARLAALRPELAELERARRLAAIVVEQLDRPSDTEPTRGGALATEHTRSIADELRHVFDALERDLTSGVDQLDRELAAVRDAAERLRLAPAGSAFTFLERAARDVAAALEKQVVFETSGGDVRLDTVVLTVVQGALLQIVRNAVAHGIEAPVARCAAGKPVAGRVTLRVAQRGRSATFTCTDDGGGIDFEGVRRMAQARGVGVEELAGMDTDALLQLLLGGGISTSATVTDVSGRGIGLDVVREAAERLGGTVSAQTDAGAGTTIALNVPLSIASFDALLVEVLGRSLAIPLDAVRATVRIDESEIVRTAQHESVLVDGRAIRLRSLQQVLMPASAPARAPRRSAIVVQGSAAVAAFSVDRITGTTQIVMRPLPPLAVATAAVSGAALDAMGNPRVILDPDGLVAETEHVAAPQAEAVAPRLPVLIVDDSLTTRMLEQSILESAGYDVDLATSAEEALDKAHAARYALFLVDVEMPGMDGFTFVERIRADPSLRDIPAILVTSRNSPEDRQRGRDAGAQGYMVKSEFAQGVLLERIRTLVG